MLKIRKYAVFTKDHKKILTHKGFKEFSKLGASEIYLAATYTLALQKLESTYTSNEIEDFKICGVCVSYEWTGDVEGEAVPVESE